MPWPLTLSCSHSFVLYVPELAQQLVESQVLLLRLNRLPQGLANRESLLLQSCCAEVLAAVQRADRVEEGPLSVVVGSEALVHTLVESNPAVVVLHVHWQVATLGVDSGVLLGKCNASVVLDGSLARSLPAQLSLAIGISQQLEDGVVLVSNFVFLQLGKSFLQVASVVADGRELQDTDVLGADQPKMTCRVVEGIT